MSFIPSSQATIRDLEFFKKQLQSTSKLTNLGLLQFFPRHSVDFATQTKYARLILKAFRGTTNQLPRQRPTWTYWRLGESQQTSYSLDLLENLLYLHELQLSWRLPRRVIICNAYSYVPQRYNHLCYKFWRYIVEWWEIMFFSFSCSNLS